MWAANVARRLNLFYRRKIETFPFGIFADNQGFGIGEMMRRHSKVERRGHALKTRPARSYFDHGNGTDSRRQGRHRLPGWARRPDASLGQMPTRPDNLDDQRTSLLAKACCNVRLRIAH